ncbi:hypothetical protein [Desertivirga xinjiangensis]|uniref:hypothetical protein n=1 Tax=Desertivirga xinjiangensis TaxID=539206 RepID=UPI002109E971|nr:hypothetical protein [Pedobacter xinjiangensis]
MKNYLTLVNCFILLSIHKFENEHPLPDRLIETGLLAVISNFPGITFPLNQTYILMVLFIVKNLQSLYHFADQVEKLGAAKRISAKLFKTVVMPILNQVQDSATLGL